MHGCRIGARVILHPGVVIGADGFGIANDNGRWIKVPQLGIVEIGDDCEVGANTTIDRGALDDTVIGDGCKLDNQIQVAHNVRIGRDSIIYPSVTIEGQSTVGAETVIGPGCRIIDSWIGSGVELKGWNYIAHTSVRNRAILEPYVRRGFD